MRLWDTHCHLADEDFTSDGPQVMARAQAAGVAAITTVAADPASWVRAAALLHRRGDAGVRLTFAAGIHPHAAGEAEGAIPRLEGALRTLGAVALGEIGLDYHYDFAPRATQRQVFAAQLRLAARLGLPVVIHEREAAADVLSVLEEVGPPSAGGIWHCFSGGPDLVGQVCALGLHLGFGGLVTFRRGTESIRAAVTACPADRLCLETDAPYLAPVPHRGKRNEPAFVAEVARFVATLRAQDPDALAAQAWANAATVFHWEGQGR